MAAINKSLTAKPILVVRFPKSFPSETIAEIDSEWSKQIRDYHLIALPCSSVSRIEFECLNPSNSPKELEELTKSLESNLKENKTKEKAEIKPL